MTTFSLRWGGQTLGGFDVPKRLHRQWEMDAHLFAKPQNLFFKESWRRSSDVNTKKTSSSDGLRFRMLSWTSQGTKCKHPASQSRRGRASSCLWLDCLLLRARCSRSRPARDHVCPEPRSSLFCSSSFPPCLFTTHTPKALLLVPFTRGQSLVGE